MSTTVQIKRGNTSAVDAYLGVMGEIIADTQDKRLRLMDGVGLGGISMAKKSEVDFPKTHGTSVASASPLVLTGTTGEFIHITGTTGFNAITLADGHTRTAIFDAILTMTPSATLLVPGNVPITSSVGDRMIIRGDAGGVVNVIDYIKNDGTAVTVPVVPAFGTPGSAVVVNALSYSPGGNRGFARLTDTLSVAVYPNATQALAVAVNVTSGGAVSLGTPFVLGTGNGTVVLGGGSVRILPLSATTAMVFYTTVTSGVYSFEFRIITVTPTTITSSAATVISTSPCNAVDAILFSAGVVWMTYTTGGSSFASQIITFTGTAGTLGATLTTATGGSVQKTAVIATSATRAYVSLVYSGNSPQTVLHNYNGTTITNITSGISIILVGIYPVAFALPNGNIAVVAQNPGTQPYQGGINEYLINGSGVPDLVAVSPLPYNKAANSAFVLPGSSGTIIMAGTYTGGPQQDLTAYIRRGDEYVLATSKALFGKEAQAIYQAPGLVSVMYPDWLTNYPTIRAVPLGTVT